jgi:hypothetical protein
MRLSEYLAPRLFEPLGIGEVSWQAWPADRELGFTGLFARTEDIAKLGQLYLQRGRWGDQQLVPEWYVEEATTAQVANPGQDNVDWQQGYGYQFWMARHGYRGDGAFGQFCLVLPEQDAVVAMTAGTEAMQAILDHAWEHLLPGLGVSEPDADAQTDLEQRLRHLSLPPAGGRPRVEDEPDWFAAPFTVLADAGDPRASRLTSVGVVRTDRGLEVTIHDPGNALTFDAGFGEWTVSEPPDVHGDPVPVAASAGWRDDQDLEIQVIFLETPHRMDIRCSLPDRTARATWRVAPLDGGRLDTLHRPARRTDAEKAG